MTIHWFGKNLAVQQIRGLWFECHFEVVPMDVRFKAYDHALERVVSRGELARHHDSYLLCTLKRQLPGKRPYPVKGPLTEHDRIQHPLLPAEAVQMNDDVRRSRETP